MSSLNDNRMYPWEDMTEEQKEFVEVWKKQNVRYTMNGTRQIRRNTMAVPPVWTSSIAQPNKWQEAAMTARSPVLGLDYETWCELDLTVVGLDRYVNHPSFRVLLASVYWEPGMAETFDFVQDYETALSELSKALTVANIQIAAHNAGFERATTRRIGIILPDAAFVDSAAVARTKGAANRLEDAAPQLLDYGHVKMSEGRRLLKKFSLAEEPPEWDDVKQDPDWGLFQTYCEVDAELSYRLVDKWFSHNNAADLEEASNEVITQSMNNIGWKVDLQAVNRMQEIYQDNMQQQLLWFRERHDPDSELNFNSSQQLIAWCKKRGVNAKSFNEETVNFMHSRVLKKLETLDEESPRYEDYAAVGDLLLTKKVLGGSSLKKLQTILDTVNPEDARLRNQYMHVGAGQTYRTSGRGVQMQNLKRLSTPRNMDELYDDQATWTNEDLAENLRQVFTASHPQGSLIVGDFASVEARGLAYLAGQEDTLEVFRAGKDLYKAQAALIYNTTYDLVTAEQRRTGKVGVLACGYQAGGGAVASFAKGMGVDMTGEEASKLVYDWRQSNPMIVQLWETLDEMLWEVVRSSEMPYAVTRKLGNGIVARISRMDTPDSLVKIHPAAKSIRISLQVDGHHILTRVIHGCYIRGRSICYYKPVATGGSLWKDRFTDPKTKQKEYYSIYGGKLSGILTQSMCRQMFFWSLQVVWQATQQVDGLKLIGQFHDEMVLDYDPTKCPWSLGETISMVTAAMSDPGILDRFPLEADVHADYRYIK